MEDQAQKDALDIAEILIMILEQLDMRTLLLAQRVCQKWVDTIRSTKSLRQALFFEPDETQSRICNPLLFASFPSFFPKTDDKESAHEFQTTTLATLALAHPQKKELYLREEASWRAMLTHKPPIRTVGKITLDSINTLSGNPHRYLEQADTLNRGLRMGDLFDWFIGVGREIWGRSRLGIVLGGADPVNNTLHLYLQNVSLNFAADAMEDFAGMVRVFDLVLVVIENDDLPNEAQGPEGDSWVNGEDLVAWEGIHEIHRALRPGSALEWRPYAPEVMEFMGLLGL